MIDIQINGAGHALDAIRALGLGTNVAKIKVRWNGNMNYIISTEEEETIYAPDSVAFGAFNDAMKFISSIIDYYDMDIVYYIITTGKTVTRTEYCVRVVERGSENG